jgi:hypothetical protein
MSEKKFTPGPWKASGLEVFSTGSFRLSTTSAGSPRICVADNRIGKGDADAHLIAAAPDMYDALEELLDALDAFSGCVDWGKTALSAAAIMKMNQAPNAAGKALRKARGEQ